jgi:hypothetical protein
MADFDLPLSIVLGVGLAAATGFRVFLPMLIVSGAAYTGHLPLTESFGWLGAPAAPGLFNALNAVRAVRVSDWVWRRHFLLFRADPP